jgi:hypothetical protein
MIWSPCSRSTSTSLRGIGRHAPGRRSTPKDQEAGGFDLKMVNHIKLEASVEQKIDRLLRRPLILFVFFFRDQGKKKNKRGKKKKLARFRWNFAKFCRDHC